MYKYFFIALGCSLLLSGCGTQNTIYHWGNYETIIYDMYIEPGEATAEVQIEKLTEDIQQSQSKGKKIAPGIYAHLGMAYAIAGQAAKSREALIKEKQLFPEATTFIDTLLENQMRMERK